MFLETACVTQCGTVCRMAWRSTPTPNKDVFTTIRFAPDETHDLIVAHTAAGVSKSAFVRRCVARCIAADKRKAEALRTGERTGQAVSDG